MKAIPLYPCLSIWLVLASARAENIAIPTVDGKLVDHITNVTVRAEGLVVKRDTTNAIRAVLIPLNKLPDNIKRRYYRYDPFEAGLTIARRNEPTDLKLDSAFRLSNLEAAKAKAKAEGKLLGFIMVWDEFFKPSKPMGRGGAHGLAHFYTAFSPGMVLVFVRHEDELDSVPGAVKAGFFGPDEGGFAPNMAVVTADCAKYICEIPFGGNGSNGQIREQVFRGKIGVIKKFLEEQDAAEAKATGTSGH